MLRHQRAAIDAAMRRNPYPFDERLSDEEANLVIRGFDIVLEGETYPWANMVTTILETTKNEPEGLTFDRILAGFNSIYRIEDPEALRDLIDTMKSVGAAHPEGVVIDPSSQTVYRNIFRGVATNPIEGSAVPAVEPPAPERPEEGSASEGSSAAAPRPTARSVALPLLLTAGLVLGAVYVTRRMR